MLGQFSMVFGFVLYKPYLPVPFLQLGRAGHHVGSILYGLWLRIVQTIPSRPFSPARQGRTPCWVNFSMVFGFVLYKPYLPAPFLQLGKTGHHGGSILYGLWPHIVQTIALPPLFSRQEGRDTMLGQFSTAFGLCGPTPPPAPSPRPPPPVHCKKELAIFPSPAGMSLTKLSLAGKKLNYSRPGRV
jgi:hypothetical protein